MTSRRKVPTEPGYYWLKEPSGPGDLWFRPKNQAGLVLQVGHRDSTNRLIVQTWGRYHLSPVDLVPGEWSDKIKPPEDF